jgi:dTDP-4-amino-4,6-dideoxygalactose transaminase
MTIRFNFPHLVGTEIEYIQNAIDCGRLSGDGPYTKKCSELLEHYLQAERVLLTHSCTAALEMSAILADIQAGDEVIMPSYTFVSTANAFVLRGAVPVFVDIRTDTLNMDESLIEAAIGPRTKSIVPVHYAGVACEMDTIMEIARRYGLLVLEDAAQALGSTYKGRKVGTIGDLASFSFHETKNIISGEGGCLAVNNPQFFDRALLIREKGTNRVQFFRGEVDKYTWVDVGSSYLPGELVASFLFAQLQHIDEINGKRMAIWMQYESTLRKLENEGFITLPVIPDECVQNAHMFYILTNSHNEQLALLEMLKEKGINAVFHYVPLHGTVAGLKFGRIGSSMSVTEDLPDRIVRLPLYPALSEGDTAYICETINQFFRKGQAF